MYLYGAGCNDFDADNIHALQGPLEREGPKKSTNGFARIKIITSRAIQTYSNTAHTALSTVQFRNQQRYLKGQCHEIFCFWFFS